MIIVYGSANLDLIGTVSRIPKPGETVPGDTFATAAGGKGANQALAARRAGAEVKIYCAVGSDEGFANSALKELRGDAVDLSALKVVPGVTTGVAMIFVDTHGENVIAILPGANGTMGVSDAEAALGAAGTADILVVQQEVPQAGTIRALELAKQKGITSILNTAPFLPTTKDAARLASIVVANETEFELLSGVAPDESVMRRWAADNAQTIIVTLGPEGAWAATASSFIRVPALKVTPVDTVGAGDTFVGYLAAGLGGGLGLEAAMRRAAVAASLACLKPGAQPAIPQAGEVAKAMQG